MMLVLAVVGVADQYMILMAITLLFSVLALAFSDSKTLSLIAGFSWLISALGTFSVGDQTSVLTSGLAWLFLGFGLVFIVKTIYDVTSVLHERRTKNRLT